MRTEPTADRAGSSGAGVVPSRVLFCTPATGGGVGAFKSVVAKLVAVVTLCVLIEAKAAFNAIGGGEGTEAGLLSKVLRFWASDGDDDG
jgi:hypothetical protein